MGIPLSRLMAEFTSADIAEYEAYYIAQHEDRNPAPEQPVATRTNTHGADKLAFMQMFGHRVKVKTPQKE